MYQHLSLAFPDYFTTGCFSPKEMTTELKTCLSTLTNKKEKKVSRVGLQGSDKKHIDLDDFFLMSQGSDDDKGKCSLLPRSCQS